MLARCASGSISPTTGRTSAAGRDSPGFAPCRRRSRVRSPASSAATRGSSSPAAPTRACTRPGQVAHVDLDVGPAATPDGAAGAGRGIRRSSARRAAARGAVARGRRRLLRRRGSRARRSPPTGSTRASRRCGAATPTASPTCHRVRPARAPPHDQRARAAGRAGDGCRGPLPHRTPRLRRLLQAPRRGDDDPDAARVRLAPRRRRGAGREHQGRRVLPQHGARARRRVRRGRARAGSMSRTSSTSATRASARTTSRCSPRADSPSPRSATRPTSCSATGGAHAERVGTASECSCLKHLWIVLLTIAAGCRCPSC